MNLEKTLKEYFGYESFRGEQKEIIEHINSREGSKGTLVVMPTGGGKSMCFQLPSILCKNLSIVVSPLVSLMKDQVDALKERGIAAEYINSSLSIKEVQDIMNKISNNEVKILYVAPERFKNKYFMNAISQKTIDILSVDEAHCVSQYGKSFRPSYRNIGKAIKKIKPRRVIALTATANNKVQADIAINLGIVEGTLFCGGFYRDDLSINVKRSFSNSVDGVVELVLDLYDPENDSGCGIVYTATRKDAEKLQGKLKRYGIPVNYYHAGLTTDKRNKIQEQWIKNDGIIIATNAFGMGIDKPNVRFVVNFGIPTSVEEWYQEIGRGSRDGKGCQCILIDTGDFIRKYLIETEYPPESALKTFENWLKNQAKKDNLTHKQTQDRLGALAGVDKKYAGGCVRFFMRQDIIKKIRNGLYQIVNIKDVDYQQYRSDKNEKYNDLNALKDLLKSNKCRMTEFCKYFGQDKRKTCGNCDNCNSD